MTATPAPKPRLCYIVDDDDEVWRVLFRTSDIAAKREVASELGCEISDLHARRRSEWDQYAATGVPALVRIDDGWWYECDGCGTTINADYIGTRERSGDEHEDWRLDAEYGPDLTVPEMSPVEPRPGRVWCHPSCHERDMAARARRRRWEERVHAWLVRRLLRRMPDADPLPLPPCEPGECSVYCSAPTHSYVYVSESRYRYHQPPRMHGWRSARTPGHQVCEASLCFRWPGAKYGCATLRIYDDRPNGKPRRAEYFCANGDREAFEAWAEAQRAKIITETAA